MEGKLLKILAGVYNQMGPKPPKLLLQIAWRFLQGNFVGYRASKWCSYMTGMVLAQEVFWNVSFLSDWVFSVSANSMFDYVLCSVGRFTFVEQSMPVTYDTASLISRAMIVSCKSAPKKLRTIFHEPKEYMGFQSRATYGFRG